VHLSESSQVNRSPNQGLNWSLPSSQRSCADATCRSRAAHMTVTVTDCVTAAAFSGVTIPVQRSPSLQFRSLTQGGP
jgi:hypothetical protein